MENETKKVLTIQDIMKEYGLSRRKVTELLTTKGCPVLPRTRGQKYLIYKDAWEKWLARE